MKILDLLETPLPDDWDKSKFKRKETSFKQMVAYARERAKLAGRGSSRVAVVIPYEGRDTVLKVAMNKKGLLQNYEEVKILQDGHTSITIPLIDYDEENGDDITWIHVEKADKITKRQLDQAFGADIVDVVRFIGTNTIPRSGTFSGSLPDEVFDNELYGELETLIADYQIKGYMDFARPANWGMYKGEPVIIDVGFHGDAYTAYIGESILFEYSDIPLVKKILYNHNTRLGSFFDIEFSGDERDIVSWLENVVQLADEEQLQKLNIRPQYAINIYRRLRSGLDKIYKNMAIKGAEPFRDTSSGLQTESGGEPDLLFRYISKKELDSILINGYIKPSEFYDRIHASHAPMEQYKEGDSTLIAIEYNSGDGWKAKVNSDGVVYAVTDKKIPIERIREVE